MMSDNERRGFYSQCAEAASKEVSLYTRAVAEARDPEARRKAVERLAFANAALDASNKALRSLEVSGGGFAVVNR